jgi:hypothetical protein
LYVTIEFLIGLLKFIESLKRDDLKKFKFSKNSLFKFSLIAETTKEEEKEELKSTKEGNIGFNFSE